MLAHVMYKTKYEERRKKRNKEMSTEEEQHFNDPVSKWNKEINELGDKGFQSMVKTYAKNTFKEKDIQELKED